MGLACEVASVKTAPYLNITTDRNVPLNTVVLNGHTEECYPQISSKGKLKPRCTRNIIMGTRKSTAHE